MARGTNAPRPDGPIPSRSVSEADLLEASRDALDAILRLAKAHPEQFWKAGIDAAKIVFEQREKTGTEGGSLEDIVHGRQA